MLEKHGIRQAGAWHDGATEQRGRHHPGPAGVIRGDDVELVHRFYTSTSKVKPLFSVCFLDVSLWAQNKRTVNDRLLDCCPTPLFGPLHTKEELKQVSRLV